MEFKANLICGLMFGIETVTDLEEVDENLMWVIVVDIAIFRFQFLKWKQA